MGVESLFYAGVVTKVATPAIVNIGQQNGFQRYKDGFAQIQITDNPFIRDHSIAVTHPSIALFPILHYRPFSVDCFSHPAIGPSRVFLLTSYAAIGSEKKHVRQGKADLVSQ